MTTGTFNAKISAYYYLTKPGIIRGNAMTAAGGFLLASRGDISWVKLVIFLIGLSLVIASACVFNNYIDREIDAKMARTKKRALVTKEVPVSHALLYGTMLGLAGLLLLLLYINTISAALGMFGFVFYVIVYGLAKRRGTYGTLVGSISGAVPPAAGYAAVVNTLDRGALLLFLILVCWQMPHFYSIALYRLKDYQTAGIPVLPAVAGMEKTKKQILLYIAAFTVSVSALTLSGKSGTTFLVIMLIVGLLWFRRGVQGYRTKDTVVWARGMFGYSLVVLLVFSVMLSADAWLP